ncbi:hypothetical protein EDB89DRAFT_2199726 [Lactarius sanguifluus]|nr:hypothetical protein EDB89DRAFT_2199726 [Lactarius sanguifluus]
MFFCFYYLCGANIVQTKANKPGVQPLFGPPFPTLYTTRKRGTTRDKPPIAPPPQLTREGGPRRWHAPPFPPFARNGGAGQETRTPPPPLGSRAGEGPHPFTRNGAATGIPPAPPSFTREQDTHTRDKSRHHSPRSRLRAREGRRRNEVRHGTGHTARDGAGEGTRNAPSPFLPGTARAMPEAARQPLSSGFRAEATHKRGARGGTRTGAPPTPFAPRRHLHAGGARSNLEQRPLSPGWRAGAAPEPERAERPPSRGHAQPQRGKNAHRRRRGTPPSPAGSRARANANGHAEATPHSPGSRQGEMEKRAQAAARNPLPLPQVRAHGGTRTGGRAKATPPFPGFARQAKRHAEVPPSPVCTPGPRGLLLARYPHLST